MKQFVSIVSLFVSLSTYCQTYPFIEGFQGILSGQIPPGWSGDIPVLSYHGINDEKGLAASLNSSDQEDSIITPSIGPIKSLSQLVFYYRWVMEFIYPSDPRYPNRKDKLEILVKKDSLPFEKLLVIDSSNHKPSLNFKRMQLSLSQYSGSVIQIMFKSTWGGGRYFQDIDSVQVIDGAFMHHENPGNYLTQNSLKIAKSPDNRKIWIIRDDINYITYQIYDMSGRLILKGQALRDEAIDLSTVHRGIYFLVVGQNVRKIFIADE